jgi:hypothetical protein
MSAISQALRRMISWCRRHRIEVVPRVSRRAKAAHGLTQALQAAALSGERHVQREGWASDDRAPGGGGIRRQLHHTYALTGDKVSQFDDFAVGKLQRIMMLRRPVEVDLAEAGERGTDLPAE